MGDQIQDAGNGEFSQALSDQSESSLPFGGTISSTLLIATLTIGLYLFYQSVTNDFSPTWKAGYWVATIFTLIVSLTWTISLCRRYGLESGQIFLGVLLSSLTVICLILVVWLDHRAPGTIGNGEVLAGVLAALFGISALGMNVVKTNLVFGVFLTAVQLAFSLILLVLLVLFWGYFKGNRRR